MNPYARHFNAEGYVLIKDPSNPYGRRYRLEHRVILEIVLGRRLVMHEVVHHLDGDKANNIPENLEIQTADRHRRIHMRREQDNRTIDGVEHRVCFMCSATSPISTMIPRQRAFVHAECYKQYTQERTRIFNEQHPHYQRDHKRRKREDPAFREHEREANRRCYARKRNPA